jgi:hypothetical protein
MKILFSFFLILTLLAGSGVTMFAQIAVPPPPMARGEHGAGKERHPEIRRAMRALENAKNDLEHASHDFGGHRQKALEHINAAVSELSQALAYDTH